METKNPPTKENLIKLGIAMAERDIRFGEKLRKIADSLELKLPNYEIIMPSMPKDVRK